MAGLGNPGEEYARTRHNVGFMVIDRLAEIFSLPLEKSKFNVQYNVGSVAGRRVFLAKPMAFMNNSGPPLANLARYFKIEDRHLLIIHDDIDLTFGQLKIKTNGGHGGHNGIASIIRAFGSKEFTRLRIGIDHPGEKEEVVGHVLGRFSTDERGILDQLIDRAGQAAETILTKGEREAMQKFHGNWDGPGKS